MINVSLRQIMVTKVVSVYVDEPFSHVEEKMRLNHVRHLPVVDHKNKLVGIITQVDLYRAVAPHETEDGFYYDPEVLDKYILKHFMTPDPHTLSPDESVAAAIKIMAEFKYGCIPIVESDKTLLGIVTQIDILKHIARNL